MENMLDTSLQQNETRVTVPDGLGLHARPAARLAKLAQQFLSEIWLSLASSRPGEIAPEGSYLDSISRGVPCSTGTRGTSADGKSIVDLLALSAPAGTVFFLYCKGVDAVEAQEAIVGFFTEEGWQGE